jgi:NTP pyrophosphatase (non-canonical NTP hydrolase)|uniref:MazG nucleotide pyrophosphohydrolase domain-containing protein n=1 Tax=Roseivirga sp. TaxID=1964215 RepID=UPI004047CD04
MNESSIERFHREMVAKLTKPSIEIVGNMGTEEVSAIHAALGIAGEAGEVVDLVKKSVINGREMDLNKLMEELGDLEYYLSLLRQTYDLDREVILQLNIIKLNKRYPDGYSDAASAARADKA